MEVVCDKCGKEYIYTGGIAHFNRCKKHFCSRYCQNVIHGLARRKNKDKRYRVWCDVKKRAKLKGTEFTLEVADIPQIPEVCPVLGIKIKANNICSPLDSSPSLDRISPKLGYVPGNVRFISNRANRIKADATLDEIGLVLEDARRIHEIL